MDGVAELVPFSMPPKEPTRQQLSRLAYDSHTPSFLVKLQNQVAGRATADDEDGPQYIGDVDEFGRERRPAESEPVARDERPSDDEDAADEKPVVVVLREGKHLTELEAQNERRKAEGLPPLHTHSDASNSTTKSATASTAKVSIQSTGLSFSSKTSKDRRLNVAKRKALNMGEKSEDLRDHPKKRSKKSSKALLSFDRDDMR